jgi:hypothetical protein
MLKSTKMRRKSVEEGGGVLNSTIDLSPADLYLRINLYSNKIYLGVIS